MDKLGQNRTFYFPDLEVTTLRGAA